MKNENGASTSWDPLKAMETYVDGKMRRYTLLFTVNGAAFAIAMLFKNEIMRGGNAPFIGALSIDTLAIGAVLFSWLMWRDIWGWGAMMRSYFNALCPKKEERLGLEVFTGAGKAILTLLVLLVTGGWLLAANSRYAIAASTISVLAIIGLVEGANFAERRREERRRARMPV